MTDRLPAGPLTTFGDLAASHLEVTVICQRCQRTIVLDGTGPALRDRLVVGRRYRCTARRCGGIGLPSIGRSKTWAMDRGPAWQPPAPGPNRDGGMTQSIDPRAPDYVETWGKWSRS